MWCCGACSASQGLNRLGPCAVPVLSLRLRRSGDQGAIDAAANVSADSNCMRRMKRNASAPSEIERALDIDALRASADRVEWRPSLPILYRVIAEFEDRERK